MPIGRDSDTGCDGNCGPGRRPPVRQPYDQFLVPVRQHGGRPTSELRKMSAARREEMDPVRYAPQPELWFELNIGGVVREHAQPVAIGLIGERALAGAGRARQEHRHLPACDHSGMHGIPVARCDQRERQAFDYPVPHVRPVGEQGRRDVCDCHAVVEHVRGSIELYRLIHKNPILRALPGLG